MKHRQEHFGPNVLTPRKGKSPLVRFLLQFNNPLIYILLAAAAITPVLKDPVDAVIILLAVLLNAVIGFVQESRAERAIEALAQAMTAEATVIRAGQTLRIPAAELVPGDVVLLKAGDKVPADVRLLSRARPPGRRGRAHRRVGAGGQGGRRARCPRRRAGRPAQHGLCLHAGHLRAGQGVVTATGDKTEVGRSPQLIASTPELTTPLTRKMAEFSQLVLYAILALAAVDLRRRGAARPGVVETFTAAIALAVAMIPEGPAGRHHRDAGHRRLAHGPPPGHRPQAARGGDPGQRHRHLLRQDRHPDPEPDDRAADCRAGALVHGHRLGYAPEGEILRDGQCGRPERATGPCWKR